MESFTTFFTFSFPGFEVEATRPLGRLAYRVTSFTKERTSLGPYRRPMPRVLGGSWGVGGLSWAKYPCAVFQLTYQMANCDANRPMAAGHSATQFEGPDSPVNSLKWIYFGGLK